MNINVLKDDPLRCLNVQDVTLELKDARTNNLQRLKLMHGRQYNLTRRNCDMYHETTENVNNYRSIKRKTILFLLSEYLVSVNNP
jgi:hypothetical protein